MRRHIHAPDLVGPGRGDLSAYDCSADLDELAAKVDIAPLQPEQFPLTHPGAYRTEEEGIEEGCGLLCLLEDCAHFLGG